MTYNSTSDTYILGHSGAGITKSTDVTNTALAGDKRQENTTSVYSAVPSGLPAAHNQTFSFERIYENFPEGAGERLLESSVNSGADKRTNTFEYYRDTAEAPYVFEA